MTNHSQNAINDGCMNSKLGSGEILIRLCKNDEVVEEKILDDFKPTGRQILEKFNHFPADEHILLMLTKDAGLVDVEHNKPIDLRKHEAQDFYVFKSDRLYYWSIDGRRCPWGENNIPESIIRKVGNIPAGKVILLEKSNTPDQEISSCDKVQLAGQGVECLKSCWRLKVQNKFIFLDGPVISVQDAFNKAGIKLDINPIITLEIEGEVDQRVELSFEIDLEEKKVRILRTTPRTINNGEGPSGLHRTIDILGKDKSFLAQDKIDWNLVKEHDINWLILHSLTIPFGYNHTNVNVAIHIPDTYPYAGLDSFHCNPELVLISGSPLPNVRLEVFINGVQYQFWSRHHGDENPWDPNNDCVETHLSMIRKSLKLEVQNEN